MRLLNASLTRRSCAPSFPARAQAAHASAALALSTASAAEGLAGVTRAEFPGRERHCDEGHEDPRDALPQVRGGIALAVRTGS